MSPASTRGDARPMPTYTHTEAMPTYRHTHQREDDALRTNTHTYAYMGPASTTCTAQTYTHTHQRKVDAQATNVHFNHPYECEGN